MELTLYKREMKGSWKLLVIFGAVLTMYVAIIISMYEPDMLKLLDSYAQAMPELMAAVGMTAGAADLLGFMISYLYGFILLVFPMVFCILRANGLVAKYVDRGSMACLLAAPVRRSAWPSPRPRCSSPARCCWWAMSQGWNWRCAKALSPASWRWGSCWR